MILWQSSTHPFFNQPDLQNNIFTKWITENLYKKYQNILFRMDILLAPCHQAMEYLEPCFDTYMYITWTASQGKSHTCITCKSKFIAAPLLTHLPLDKVAAILADDIFNCIFLNENDRIPIQISLNYITGSPIDKKSALVQLMAWRQTGDKPLPEQWWPSSLTHICDTRGRWVIKELMLFSIILDHKFMHAEYTLIWIP